jgi:hypothetical protein
MTPMNKPRAYFGSMLDYFHKRIYAFGGSNSTKCLNDIEVYDIENDAWKKVGFNLPSPTFAFSFK